MTSPQLRVPSEQQVDCERIGLRGECVLEVVFDPAPLDITSLNLLFLDAALATAASQTDRVSLLNAAQALVSRLSVLLRFQVSLPR